MNNTKFLELLEMIEASEELNELIKIHLQEIEFPAWSKKLGSKILPNYGVKSTDKPTQDEIDAYKKEVAQRKKQNAQNQYKMASRINQNIQLRKDLGY